MNSAAVEYQRRLQWVTDAQANTAVWSTLSTMWSKLGGTGADFSGIFDPLNAVATQLPGANKASYNAIITACDSILSAVSMPLSLWPE